MAVNRGDTDIYTKAFVQEMFDSDDLIDDNLNMTLDILIEESESVRAYIRFKCTLYGKLDYKAMVSWAGFFANANPWICLIVRHYKMRSDVDRFHLLDGVEGVCIIGWHPSRMSKFSEVPWLSNEDRARCAQQGKQLPMRYVRTFPPPFFHQQWHQIAVERSDLRRRNPEWDMVKVNKYLEEDRKNRGCPFKSEGLAIAVQCPQLAQTCDTIISKLRLATTCRDIAAPNFVGEHAKLFQSMLPDFIYAMSETSGFMGNTMTTSMLSVTLMTSWFVSALLCITRKMSVTRTDTETLRKMTPKGLALRPCLDQMSPQYVECHDL